MKRLAIVCAVLNLGAMGLRADDAEIKELREAVRQLQREVAELRAQVDGQRDTHNPAKALNDAWLQMAKQGTAERVVAIGEGDGKYWQKRRLVVAPMQRPNLEAEETKSLFRPYAGSVYFVAELFTSDRMDSADAAREAELSKEPTSSAMWHLRFAFKDQWQLDYVSHRPKDAKEFIPDDIKDEQGLAKDWAAAFNASLHEPIAK
jgi:hypothetical protein